MFRFTLRDLFMLTFLAALLAFAIATGLRPRQRPPLEFVGPDYPTHDFPPDVDPLAPWQ